MGPPETLAFLGKRNSPAMMSLSPLGESDKWREM